jgi:hypothetical protein
VWTWEVGDGGAIGEQRVSQQGVLPTTYLEDVERPPAAELGVRRAAAVRPT